MPEQIITELVADPTKHTAGVAKAKKDAQEFDKAWQDAAAKTGQSSERMGQSMGQVASGARGAASQIALLAKGGGDLENALSATSAQLGQMGNALVSMAGGAGTAVGKVGSLLGVMGPWGAVAGAGVGIALDLGGALLNMVQQPTIDKTAALTREVAALDEAMAQADRTASTFLQHQAQITEDEIRARHASNEAARQATEERTRAALAGGGIGSRAPQTEQDKEAVSRGAALAAQRRAERKASAERGAEALRSMADAGIDDAARYKALPRTDLAEARGAEALRSMAGAEIDDAARYKALPRTDLAPPDKTTRASATDISGSMGVAEKGLGMTMGMALFGETDPTGEQTIAATDTLALSMIGIADAAGQVGEKIAAMGIATAMEAAIGPSVKYVKSTENMTKAQKAQAKAEKASQLSTAETFKVATRDALKSIAIKAAIEGAFKIASSIFPPNPAGLASGAALLAVAAAAGGAAAAIGPVTKTIPSSRTPSEPRETKGGGVGLGAQEKSQAEVTNIVINVLPGTDETRIGEAMERSINSARRNRGRASLP